MPVTILSATTGFGDMSGPLAYWGPVTDGRGQPTAIRPGITPLSLAKAMLRTRSAEAA